jgi:hypothetical protein
MYRCHRWLLSIVGLSLLCCANSVCAQTSSTQSYADRQLGRFRSQDVGNYSVGQFIKSDLQSAQVRGVGINTRSSISRSYGGLGLSSASTSKPFSTLTSSPTVSPYMNLFRDDLSGESDLNYQTLVRPQLEQQRVNAQVQRQNMELARRVQSISAKSDYGNPQGSETQYPTGHPTSFRYYSHFYPSAGGGRR